MWAISSPFYDKTTGYTLHSPRTVFRSPDCQAQEQTAEILVSSVGPDRRDSLPIFRQAAWYDKAHDKAHPTFADALALVRKEMWASATFYGSPAQSDTVKVAQAFVERLTDALCYAAVRDLAR